MSFIELAIKTGYAILGLKRGTDTPPNFQKELVKKILVVRNDNLGDVILTVPALRALRENFPNAYLAVLVNAYTRPALEGTPWIDKIYSYDKFKHGKHATRFHAWLQQYKVTKNIQKENFDLAVGIRSNFSSSHAHLVYSSAARWRLGHAPQPKKKNLGFFYNIYVSNADHNKHEVERSLDVVREIGVDTNNKELEFFIPQKNTEEINRWLAKNNLFPPLVGVFLSQRIEENRYWSTEKYISLLNAIQKKDNYTPVLIYAKADEQKAQDILNALETPVFLFSTPDLKSLAALLRHCKPVITLEGGGMHIATAVTAPTIAIFCKSNPLLWAPWGENHKTLKKGNHADLVSAEDVLQAIASYRD